MNKVFLATLRHNEQFRLQNKENSPIWEVNVPGTSLVVIRQLANKNKMKAIDGSRNVYVA